MSESRFGKCSSARNRPRAAKASQQLMPDRSSCIPLRIVMRFHPNSFSARRCPPIPKDCTVRAMNSRRWTPRNVFPVATMLFLNPSVSSMILLLQLEEAIYQSLPNPGILICFRVPYGNLCLLSVDFRMDRLRLLEAETQVRNVHLHCFFD